MKHRCKMVPGPERGDQRCVVEGCTRQVSRRRMKRRTRRGDRAQFAR